VGDKFFTKDETKLHAKQSTGAQKRGVPRQVPRSPPLKHTTDSRPLREVYSWETMQVKISCTFVMIYEVVADEYRRCEVGTT